MVLSDAGGPASSFSRTSSTTAAGVAGGESASPLRSESSSTATAAPATTDTLITNAFMAFQVLVTIVLGRFRIAERSGGSA